MSTEPHQKHTVYIALGSNLGKRAANLRAALAGFAPALKVCRASPVYETEPWGFVDQPSFLNQVIEAETQLPPEKVLAFLKNLEVELGRQPTFRNGPRLIDLDLLFYDDWVFQSEALAVPHPRLAERAFVLVPLADLAPDLIHPQLNRPVRELLAGVDRSGVKAVQGRMLPFGVRTFVMGIINVTPDSFSGEGILQSGDPVETAVEQARRFIEAGADILDVGGESTRPGAQLVDQAQELNRVVPVIDALRSAFKQQYPEVLISVDTYKAGVAEAALQAGADWVNDVWGLRADPRMGEVVARANAPVILMHNRSKPASAELQERLGGRYVGVEYEDLIGDIQRELLQSVELAHRAGITDENIILDPGIGFGKTVEQNLELLDRLDAFTALGYPLLLGVSRKSFIGYTLNLPPDQRLEGTAAATALGIDRGADIIRVHDVAFMARVARMTDAIVRRGRQPAPSTPEIP
ncbi:MAG: dihydropteroate synthase [Chloroflexi bacterium]|nr:dihydropteroate synthase [Chloroflexota bacterium]